MSLKSRTFVSNVFNNMCRINGLRTILVLANVNRSTFHEDVLEKRFVHFRS